MKTTKLDDHQHHHLWHSPHLSYLAPTATFHQQQSLSRAAVKRKQNIKKKKREIKQKRKIFQI